MLLAGQVHTRKLKLGEDADDSVLRQVARDLPGLSGARIPHMSQSCMPSAAQPLLLMQSVRNEEMLPHTEPLGMPKGLKGTHSSCNTTKVPCSGARGEPPRVVSCSRVRGA
jgi:hypothetical protein